MLTPPRRYHQGHLWIIDVSQSVEHDHPRAFDFLRADIAHVDDYFSKRGGVATLGLRATFDWITREPQARAHGGRRGGRAGLEKEDGDAESAVVLDKPAAVMTDAQRAMAKALLGQDGDEPAVPPAASHVPLSGPFASIEVQPRAPGESDAELTDKLEQLMTRLAAGETVAPPESSNLPGSHADTPAPSTERPRGTAQDEAVFKDAYIPRTLDEVYDPERDVAILQKPGGAQELIYAGVTGMGGVQEGEQKQAAESSDGSDGSDSEGDSGDEEDGKPRVLRGHRHEDRDAKKVSTGRCEARWMHHLTLAAGAQGCRQGGGAREAQDEDAKEGQGGHDAEEVAARMAYPAVHCFRLPHETDA